MVGTKRSSRAIKGEWEDRIVISSSRTKDIKRTGNTPTNTH